MAATTISRTTWTDGVSGTVIANARLQDIYDKIDAVLGANVTFGGTVSAEGFGTHLFSAGGSGANTLRIRNSSAGTANVAALQVGNDSNASLGEVLALSSTYTSSPGSGLHANGITVRSNGAGGLNLVADSAGAIRLLVGGPRYSVDTTNGLVAENAFGLRIKNSSGTIVNGVTLDASNHVQIGADTGVQVDTVISAGTTGAIRFRANAAERMVMTTGGLLQVGDGTVGGPGLSFLADTDTGFYRSATNEVSLATAGTRRATIDANGRLELTSGLTLTGVQSVTLSAGANTIALNAGTMVLEASTTAAATIQAITGAADGRMVLLYSKPIVGANNWTLTNRAGVTGQFYMDNTVTGGTQSVAVTRFLWIRFDQSLVAGGGAWVVQAGTASL